LEFIESFVNISLQNEEQIKKHIAKLNDIMQMYLETCSLNNVGTKEDETYQKLAELIAYFKNICLLTEELRHRMNSIHSLREVRYPSRGLHVEVDEMSSCLSKVEMGRKEIERGTVLLSRFKEEVDDSSQKDYCLSESITLIGKTEEVCQSCFEYIHQTREKLRQIDDEMTACCQPQYSSFSAAAPIKKDEPKRGGLKSWFSSHMWGSEKKGETKSVPVANVTLPKTACSSEDVAVLEETDKTDIAPLEISNVQFSAIVQKKVEHSVYLPINIIMYEDEFRNVVEDRLDKTIKETRSGYHSVTKNSVIKVALSSKDISIDDCEEERVWHGKYLDIGFVVEIPETITKKQIMFCASVYVNDLIATKLKFFVDVVCDDEQQIKIQREDITTAFVSYASKDRNRVASIIQGMKKARPDMDVFFDVETLRSGQKWEEALKNEIDNRSIFFLCWSKSASESKWVEFEWRYALEKKGDDCIEPIPIEPPEECPPPAELQQKHFNDKLVYVIKALEYMNKKRAYVIRKANDEKIYINKNSFTIGKLGTLVDYAISNNHISKMHAEIVCEEGVYFILDHNSTNKTYVNDIECVSGQKTKLENGALIRLANEELLFELS